MSKKSSAIIARLVIGGVLLLGPLMTFWVLVSSPDNLAGVPAVEPDVFVMPTRVNPVPPVPAVARVTWSGEETLGSPAFAGGIVTGMPTTSPTIIQHLDEVVEIDGITRIAAKTERPFFRSLTRGDKGVDVEELQQILTDLGLYEGPIDGNLQGSTSTALGVWLDDLSAPSRSPVFLPEYVIWLSSDSFSADVFHFQLGLPAPAAGTALATDLSNILSVELEPTQQLSADLRDNGDLAFVVNEQSFDITNQLQLEAPDQFTSVQAVPSEDLVAGFIEDRSGTFVLSVPASSVFESDGEVCILTSSAGTESSVVAEVVGSNLGVVYIADVFAGDEPEVLANPLRTSDRSPSCVSS